MKYTVIIEKNKNSYGAHVPDLPGCVAIAETKDEVIELIKESISLHLESMIEEDIQIPKPNTSSFEIELQ